MHGPRQTPKLDDQREPLVLLLGRRVREMRVSGVRVRHRCGMSPKEPKPKGVRSGDIRSAGQAAIDAAQAAVDAAQAVTTGALRIPSASARLAAQLPDLLENLATTTERLNSAMDRLDRYLALAEPTLRTMDRLLPQLEALVATGEDIYGALSRIPGVSALTRFAGGQSSDDNPRGKRKK